MMMDQSFAKNMSKKEQRYLRKRNVEIRRKTRNFGAKNRKLRNFDFGAK